MSGAEGFFSSPLARRGWPSDIAAIVGREPARSIARALLFLPLGPALLAPVATVTSTSTAAGIGAPAFPAPAAVVLGGGFAGGVGIYAAVAPIALVLGGGFADGVGATQAYAPAAVVASFGLASGVGVNATAPVAALAPPSVVRSSSLAEATKAGVRLRATLLGKLSPKISQLKAGIHKSVGDRPYRVFLVRSDWSGGRVGSGTRNLERTELGCGVDKKTGLVIPPEWTFTSPYARPRFKTDRRGASASNTDQDTSYITDLDPAMTEKHLVRFGESGREEYIEIEQFGISGGNSNDHSVSRYRVSGRPTFNSKKLCWDMSILPQDTPTAFGQLWQRR